MAIFATEQVLQRIKRMDPKVKVVVVTLPEMTCSMVEARRNIYIPASVTTFENEGRMDSRDGGW